MLYYLCKRSDYTYEQVYTVSLEPTDSVFYATTEDEAQDKLLEWLNKDIAAAKVILNKLDELERNLNAPQMLS